MQKDVNKKTVALSEELPEVRCRCCSRLLFRGMAEELEIKCPKCGFVQRFGRRCPSNLRVSQVIKTG